MKVILLQDVAKIGRKNQVVTVPDGYAANQLIPKRLAAPATPENLKKVNLATANQEAGIAKADEQLATAKEVLSKEPLSISVKVNDQGHLFAALKPEVVVEALQQKGLKVDLLNVTIESPIKSVGEHLFTLGHKNGRTSFPINIISE